jgi:hypothetical protein
MESRALESQMYGDPMEVYAAKQARERRAAEKAAQNQPKRPTLSLKPRDENGWSKERRAAEELFSPPSPVRER